MVTTGLLEEKLLTLLLYWLGSSRVKKILMLCKLWAVSLLGIENEFLMEFARTYCHWLANQSCAHLLAKSFHHSLVSESKDGIGTNPHLPNLILCKHCTAAEKGVCSDSNQAAQLLQMGMSKLEKLGNNLWHQYEFIASKVYSQISCKWNAIFESHLESNPTMTILHSKNCFKVAKYD